MAFTLHPARSLCLYLGCSRLQVGLGGGYWKEKRGCTRATSSPFVIFVVSVDTNLAGPYLWHGILMVQVTTTASV